MLTLEKIRKIDPSLASLSDAEVLEIRDQLYELGQLAFSIWWVKKNGSKDPIRSLDNPPISGIVKTCKKKSKKRA